MRNSLSYRIVLQILVSSLIIFSVVIYFFINNSSKSLKNESYKHLLADGEEKANAIKSNLDKALASTITLARTLESMVLAKYTDRESVRELVRFMTEMNTDVLSFWVTWEPNGFDGMDSIYSNRAGSNEVGRFEPCWYRDKNKVEESISPEDEVLTNDYYQIPRKTLETTLIEPYYFSYTGDDRDSYFECSVVVPIMLNNKFLGVAGTDKALIDLQREFSTHKFLKTGYLQLISNSGIVVVDKEVQNVGKAYKGLSSENGQLILESIKSGTYFENYNNHATTGKKMLNIFIPLQMKDISTPWSVCISVPEEELSIKASSVAGLYVRVGILAQLLLIIFIILITLNIVIPLRKLNKSLQKFLKDGDLTKLKKFSYQLNDELLDISNSISNLYNDIKTTSDKINQVGQGDLSVDFVPKSNLDTMSISFSKMKSTIQKDIKEENESNLENTKRNWLTNGTSSVTESINKSIDDIRLYCENVLSEIIAYSEAKAAAIYLKKNRETDELFLQAGIVESTRLDLSFEVMSNVTLVGTCAFEKKMIYIENLPENYVTRYFKDSGVKVSKALFFPLQNDKKLVGVCEILTDIKLEKHHFDYYEFVIDSLSSVLYSKELNEGTENLLNNSETQKLMLEKQQKEMIENIQLLRITQDELVQKEMKLKETLDISQKQEEELKYQMKELRKTIRNITKNK